MAGRPLPEMAAISARVPRGEAGYWEIMRRLDKAKGSFTVADVEGETNVKAGSVAQYLRKLCKAGIAFHWDDRLAPVRPAKVYRLAKNAPALAPRLDAEGKPLPPPMRDCLWRAMRTLRSGFSARELVFSAASVRKIPLATAERYLIQLEQAGYLVRNGAHFMLKPSMNTGPLAPAILRVHAVWDRNLKRVVGESDAQEVA